MSVRVKGFDKLIDKSARKMIVTEGKVGYEVEIKNKIINLSSEETSFNGPSDTNELASLMSMFLNDIEVTSIGLSRLSFNENLFFSVIGDKKMYLQVSDNTSDELYKLMISKYIRDRAKYLNDNSFLLYNVSSSGTCSNYLKHQTDWRDFMQIDLMCEKDELLSFEKEFIEKFVWDKLCEVGEEAVIMTDREFLGKRNRKCFLNYYICCDDMAIIFSNEKQFMFLFDVVNKYNNEVVCNVKKRSMKEGN